MYNNLSLRVSHACRMKHEKAVQGGLSLTPAEMLQLASEGKPIAAGMQSHGVYDNTPQGDFYVPLEFSRGIEITDLYMAKKEGQSKLRKAVSVSKSEPKNS